MVAWPIEVTRKNGYIAYLEAPRPCFRAHFRFCSATAVYRPTPAHTRHTPLGPGAVLFDLGLRSPRDHARLFQNRTCCVEIDPKSIYVDILGPHPDRPPAELLKNAQKSSKIATFSILFEIFKPCLLQQRHRTISDMQNIHFFLVTSIVHPTTRFRS